MLPQDDVPGTLPKGEQIYISCCVEDLIGVEMDAWKRGYDQAHSDGLATLRDIEAIEHAAENALDEALLVYVPLDLTRFRDVFIRAWCGGYCTRLHESQAPQASAATTIAL